MMGNCVGQRNRPSRQLEVPDEIYCKVIKLISAPTHSLGWCCAHSWLALTVYRGTSVYYYSQYDSIPHLPLCLRYPALLPLRQPFRSLYIHQLHMQTEGHAIKSCFCIILRPLMQLARRQRQADYRSGSSLAIYMRCWNIFNKACLFCLDLV